MLNPRILYKKYSKHLSQDYKQFYIWFQDAANILSINIIEGYLMGEVSIKHAQTFNKKIDAIGKAMRETIKIKDSYRWAASPVMNPWNDSEKLQNIWDNYKKSLASNRDHDQHKQNKKNKKNNTHPNSFGEKIVLFNKQQQAAAAHNQDNYVNNYNNGFADSWG